MSGGHKVVKVALFALMLVVITGVAVLALLQPDQHLASLPQVTTASLNHAGDPINIALVGDKDAITKAFLAAHWLIPDPINASSTVKIIETSIANAAYPAAPVSSLHLFGRVQDLAFELPTNTVRNRNHVRLWQTTKLVSGKPLWIGSASYDSGLGLSGTTALPTHHISPDVDSTRGFVAGSLRNSGLVQSESLQRISYPTLWGFNGGGDWYFDDGLVAVLVVQ